MSDALIRKIKAANTALMDQGNSEAVADYFATDYVAHVTGADIKGGHATIQGIVTIYRRAFPDIKTSVEILAVQHDRVAWQRTMHATHKAAFKGFPATNRPMVWRDMITSRFNGDLIAEEWFITDLAEQLLLARKKLKK